jgi:hypothetical protein
VNAPDVLRYGHLTLLDTFGNVPDDMLDEAGACGVWSIRDIMGHLASYELVLVDVLGSLGADAATPVLDRFLQGPEFNDLEVEARRERSLADVLAELNDAHARTLELIATVPAERLRQAGTLPWYGDAYALDDLIVYQYYGHKREHAAQIEAFRDRQSQLA